MHPRQWLEPRQLWFGMAGLLLMVLGLPAIIVTKLAGSAHTSPADVASILIKQLLADWPKLLRLLCYAGFGSIVGRIMLKARGQARLILSDDGITHESALPRLLRSTRNGNSDWHLSWDDIVQVDVHPLLHTLRIRSKGWPPVVLRAHDWVEESQRERALLRRSELKNAMFTSTVWREFNARGLFQRRGTEPADALSFDLSKHPLTQGTMLLGAACILYAAIDGVLCPESYPDFKEFLPYLLPPTVIGCVCGALASLTLSTTRKPTRVPPEVTVVLAMLFALASAAAGYSGMLRINQWLGEPLRNEIYRRSTDCLTLLPQNPQLPRIDYSARARKFWCGFSPDQDIPVPLRKGLFGLYQMDLSDYSRRIGASAATGKSDHK